MADVLMLGTLNLNSGNIQVLSNGLEFEEPRQRVTRQDYLLDHGGKVTDRYYENAIRRIKLKITGANKEAVLTNINSVIAELAKDSNVLAFQADGATDTSYANVLGASISSTSYDWYFSQRNVAHMLLELECKPTWRSNVVTLPVNLVKDGRLNCDDSGDGVANSWTEFLSGTPGGACTITDGAQKIQLSAANTAGNQRAVRQTLSGLSAGDVVSGYVRYKSSGCTNALYGIYLNPVGAEIKQLVVNSAAIIGEFAVASFSNWIIPSGFSSIRVEGLVSSQGTDATGDLLFRDFMIIKSPTAPSSFYESNFTPPATIDVPDIPGDIEALTQIDIKTEGATGLSKIRVGKKTDANINYLENFEGIIETDDFHTPLETNVTNEASNTARNYDYLLIASANIPTDSGSPKLLAYKALEVSKYKGKYRVFARVKCSAAYAVYWRVYTTASTSASKKTNSYVSHNTATWVYLDLGEIDIPHIEIASISQTEWIIGLQVYKSNNAVDAWTDYLILLPADEGWGAQSDTIIQNDHHVQDSLTDVEQVYLIKSTLLTSGSAVKDFTSKVYNDTSICPHVARKQDSTDSTPVKTSGTEFSQGDYDNIEANDAANATHTTTPSTGADTDITTPSTAMTASSTHTNLQAPSCTVNNDANDDAWGPQGSSGEWLKADLGSLQPITKVGIKPHASGTANDNVSSIQVSANNVDWTQVSGATDIDENSETLQWITFTVANARYVKINWAGACIIHEIEIRLTGNYYTSPTYSEDIYEFDISNINVSDITQLTPLVEAGGSGNGGNGASAYIWDNSGGGSWEEVEIGTLATTEDLTKNIAANFGNYIDTLHKLYVLCRSKYPSTSPAATTNASVVTDYPKLTVSYTQATESGIANYVGDVIKLDPGDNKLVIMFERASLASGLDDDAEVTIQYKSRHLNYL